MSSTTPPGLAPSKQYPLSAKFFEVLEALVVSAEGNTQLPLVLEAMRGVEMPSLETALDYACMRALAFGGTDRHRFAATLFRVTAVLPNGNRQGAKLVPAVFAQSSGYLRANLHEIVLPVVSLVFDFFVKHKRELARLAKTEAGKPRLRDGFVSALAAVDVLPGCESDLSGRRAETLEWLLRGAPAEVEALLVASAAPASGFGIKEMHKRFRINLFDRLWQKQKEEPFNMACLVVQLAEHVEVGLTAAFEVYKNNEASISRAS